MDIVDLKDLTREQLFQCHVDTLKKSREIRAKADEARKVQGDDEYTRGMVELADDYVWKAIGCFKLLNQGVLDITAEAFIKSTVSERRCLMALDDDTDPNQIYSTLVKGNFDRSKSRQGETLTITHTWGWIRITWGNTLGALHICGDHPYLPKNLNKQWVKVPEQRSILPLPTRYEDAKHHLHPLVNMKKFDRAVGFYMHGRVTESKQAAIREILEGGLLYRQDRDYILSLFIITSGLPESEARAVERKWLQHSGADLQSLTAIARAFETLLGKDQYHRDAVGEQDRAIREALNPLWTENEEGTVAGTIFDGVEQLIEATHASDYRDEVYSKLVGAKIRRLVEAAGLFDDEGCKGDNEDPECSFKDFVHAASFRGLLYMRSLDSPRKEEYKKILDEVESKEWKRATFAELIPRATAETLAQYPGYLTLCQRPKQPAEVYARRLLERLEEGVADDPWGELAEFARWDGYDSEGGIFDKPSLELVVAFTQAFKQAKAEAAKMDTHTLNAWFSVYVDGDFYERLCKAVPVAEEKKSDSQEGKEG